MKARVLGVIPARLGSSRLPRKPLHPLAGRPLLEWVWRRVAHLPLLDRVVIATDSEEIAAAAAAFGAAVEMTSAAHPTGTDRVAEVAARPAYREFDAVANIQGDEPFLDPAHLAAAVGLVAEGGWPIGTVAAPIADAAELASPAVVKVVCGDDGAALLFSRSPIPHVRDAVGAGKGLPDGVFLRHVGIYAYRRDALERWVALPEGQLEQLEKLEQLRPLAAGLRIGVARVHPAEPGVDTPEDAERADRQLRALNPIHAAER